MHPETGRQKHVETALSGTDLLNDPLLNKGTAFTEAERSVFALHGLLPPHIGTLNEQVSRRLRALHGFHTPFQRYAFLRDLQDVNETLFYAMLVKNLEEMLPIVYTPTVGEGCQRFSEIWRKPHGVFLSYPNKQRISTILAHPRYDHVRVIVVSDGERILGLGDQGAGGMGIPIGKLALYTACAGIHPRKTLPILLDLGTDNEERLADPLYVGWNHKRVRGDEYDEFVDIFVNSVMDRWPHILLQWEDFAGGNASRLLERYRDRLCTFNDDIQGTAAVAAATLLSATHATKVPISEQRIVLAGAGSAGIRISSLLLTAMVEAGLSEAEARSRFYTLNRNGLVLESTPGLRPEQRRFALPADAVADWNLTFPDKIELLDVVRNAKPTTLIGVSGQRGLFTEDIVREMARLNERPIIFPLSNPTSQSEATPEDLMTWSSGRAVIGTGSPFPPAEWNGERLHVDQVNNSYIFPGMGLGVLSSGARRVTDAMFMAAAKALADLSPARLTGSGRLLPPVNELRSISVKVAAAVTRQAWADGVAPMMEDSSAAALNSCIRSNVWEPVYMPYRLKAG